MQAENQLAALERDMKEKMESAEKEVSSCSVARVSSS